MSKKQKQEELEIEEAEPHEEDQNCAHGSLPAEEEDAKPKKKKELSQEKLQHLERIRKLASEKKKALAIADPNSVRNRIEQKKQKQEAILKEFERKQKNNLLSAPPADEEDVEQKIPKPQKSVRISAAEDEDVVIKNASYYRNKYKTLKQQHQELAMKTIDALELQREKRNNMARLMGIHIND